MRQPTRTPYRPQVPGLRATATLAAVALAACTHAPPQRPTPPPCGEPSAINLMVDTATGTWLVPDAVALARDGFDRPCWLRAQRPTSPPGGAPPAAPDAPAAPAPGQGAAP